MAAAEAHLGAAVSALPPALPYLAGGSSPSVADVACATLFPALSWVDKIAGPPTARASWWGAVPTVGAVAPAPAGKKRGGGEEGVGGVSVGGKKSKEPGGSGAASSSQGGISAAVLALSTYTTAAPIHATSATDMALPILQHLRALFTLAIRGAFPAAAAACLSDLEADMSPNSNSKFVHHYQCNSAMTVFARLKKLDPPSSAGPAGASPVSVASALMAHITASGPHPLIGKMEVSGPGYVNVYLAHNYVTARLSSLLVRGPAGCLPLGETPRKVIIDYSSPNIAKDMHIGHLRSTIIGDALGRLLEFAGHTVERVNHVGDWGTQFGMLIAHVKDLLREGVVAKEEDLYADIENLTRYYKEAKARFDGKEVGVWPADASFKTRAHSEVVALQSGDPVNGGLWERMVATSSTMFNSVYSALGIDSRLTLRGESFYNPYIPPLLKELEEGGHLEDSEGALVMRVPGGQGVPLMVRKGDGGFGYDSTDLAALRYRLKDCAGTWLIYVVDSGQALHFELVFAGGVKAGWWPGPSLTSSTTNGPRVVHAGFGVMQGTDGKKFKTRDGSTVRLQDVMKEAKERAMGVLLERAGEKSIGGGADGTPAATASTGSLAGAATAAEMEKTATSLAYGGIKYFDLRQNRLSDYVFSYDRMLSADGDTAVYMQYTQARLASILRKASAIAGVPVLTDLPLGDPAALAAAWVFEHPTEVLLAAELLRFGDVIAGIQVDLMPHRLCEYMYGVASRATEFHRDCNVLGANTAPSLRDARLRLVSAARSVLTTSMTLLGLEPLDRI